MPHRFASEAEETPRARTLLAQVGGDGALAANDPLRVGGSFPLEAQRWGFEGWAKTQFDIGADGRVLNERAMLAYPPFVFSRAGAQTIAGARFAPSFRPDGGLGCGAQTTRVLFQLPS